MKQSVAVIVMLALFVGSAGTALAQELKDASESNDGAGVASGAAVAVEEAFESVEYEDGDEFSVEMGGDVPADQRGDYREFAEPGPDDGSAPGGTQLLVDGAMVSMGNEFGSPAYFERVQAAVDEIAKPMSGKAPVDLTESEDKVRLKQLGRKEKAIQQLREFVNAHVDPKAPNARAMAMLDDATRASMVGMQLQAILQATQYEEYELKKRIEDLPESEGKAFISDEEANFEKDWREALGIKKAGT